MATYRALQDIWLGGNWPYVQAGAMLTDGPGGNIPKNWVPPAAVDPISADAIQNFFNVGVQRLGLVRQQWQGVAVAAPAIYWKLIDRNTDTYQLTGAGAALGTAQLVYRGTVP